MFQNGNNMATFHNVFTNQTAKTKNIKDAFYIQWLVSGRQLLGKQKFQQ